MSVPAYSAFYFEPARNTRADEVIRYLHLKSYAQERYRELTGWLCPAQGGPKSKELTLEQKGLDHKARLIIRQKLGHGRRNIVSVYCGK